MKSLLCFGDSNTFGTQPMRALGEERRFDFSQRWPGVVQARLGAAWRVVEEGLPGRTISRDDPVEGENRNALRYLAPCLRSHRPLDAIVFFLGVNDLKARFGVPAQRIAQDVHLLLDTVAEHTLPQAPRPRLLVVSPPPVVEVGPLAQMFNGAAERSVGLASAMAEVAQRRGVDFLDAAQLIAVSPLDGVHFEAADHARLGERIAAWVLSLD